MPQVAFDPDGDAWSWSEWTPRDDSSHSHSSYRPRGGVWGSPQRFANGDDTPATAFYGNGNAVAVWTAPTRSGKGEVVSRMLTVPH